MTKRILVNREAANVALVALAVGGLAAYVLLGAAGFWEPLPPLVPLVPVVLY